MEQAIFSKMAVLGAGSWGTALAMLFARRGVHVKLWGRDAVQIRSMQESRQNAKYLPGCTFPDGLEPVLTVQEALDDAELVLVAVPSAAFFEIINEIKSIIASEQGLIWATKGLDHQHGGFLSELVETQLGMLRVGVLSGPSFAQEVAQDLPTAMTIASTDDGFAQEIQACLAGNTSRLYTSRDLIGVQIGGFMKNVLALATGISDGVQLGANARAALITRGLREMMRLGETLGAEHDTFMGLAGLGDLVLTCTDNQSRNRRFGLALGRGLSFAEARAQVSQVVEGIETTKLVHHMATKLHIEMPITAVLYEVLFHQLSIPTALNLLITRQAKPEQS